MIGSGPRRRRSGDEVLDAIDSLLVALGESVRRHDDAARQARTVRRLRSHGRSYATILASAPLSPQSRVTRQATEAVVLATERLDRAAIGALVGEGVAVDRIAVLCGMSEAEVGTFMAGPS